MSHYFSGKHIVSYVALVIYALYPYVLWNKECSQDFFSSTPFINCNVNNSNIFNNRE